MHLKDFALRFEKLSGHCGLNYSLAEPATERDVSQAEENLGVSFPPQLALFYRCFNGVRVAEPQLEILPIEQLQFTSENRIHFATIDGERRLFFDTSRLNDAEQWNIVTQDGFRVTLTMASFWSNKIWAWVERKKKIWEEEQAI